MIKLLLIFLFSLFFFRQVFSTEITVIELHNKSLDQLVIDNLENNDVEENSENDLLNIEIFETEESNDSQKSESDENLMEPSILANDENKELLLDEVVTDEISEITYAWNMTSKNDFLFLLENVDQIRSPVLKKELLSILDVDSLMPNNINKEEFDKAIIDSLISLGNNKKSFDLIQKLKILENNNFDSFYKEFELNYLLSTYNLSEACNYRNEIKTLNLKSNNNFFLKLDIFCYILNEKFNEATLMNSLLEESEITNDDYFQYLFNLLQKNDEENKNEKNLKEGNFYLYSAMHRVGEIPLTDKFLDSDPLNLSIPIILSKDTNIELRLKAAHFAYLNTIINTDSLSALYQIVDFNFEELNDPNLMLPVLNSKIEIGMAYYYQLINIQILPISRLEAIIKFWDFAEENNLELIAYNLSIKNLDTIDPASELSSYGPKIAKAYIYNGNFEMANKWLMFSQNISVEDELLYEFNSAELLYKLYNLKETENIAKILFENLTYMNKNLLDTNDKEYNINIETLNIIFSLLKNDILNPFSVEKKIYEERLMPSLYISDLIKNAIKTKNHYEILLSLVASLNNRMWNELHPEHLRLSIECIKEYKDGKLLNEFLLEILKQNNII